LQRQWYVSGRPYRELDHIDGTPNPVFNGWLEHPSYDAYWRALIPYRDEFARIDIPVLTTTGYYDSGQIGALYYVREHLLHRPRAEHYLVIGPYDHIRGQRGTITPATGARQTVLRNYALDEVAQIDIGELRYQWFDYVLRGGRKPALLADRINYEVMGANVWKHAASIEAMHDATLRLYLRADGTLSRKMARGFTSHVVDLADRSDADLLFRGAIIDEALDDWNIVDSAPKIANAVQFLSEPLAEPIEISGLFSGVLDVVANKKDFDFSVSLLEVTPGGDYVRLSYAWSRASYARNREQRSLLQRGRRTRLPLQSRRLTSRRVGAGSRLLVVIGVIKQPSEQINYGTGKDVSDESIADAREPLRLRWLADSYIDVPVMKEK
jgi:putative CocE/NonD family hydrolase